MTKLHLIALEPMDSRYTGQWLQWFPPILREAFDVLVHVPNMGIIKEPTGEHFFDWRQTLIWKYRQMSSLLEDVKDGDVVFFLDGEHPGLEGLEYLRRMENLDVRVFQIWHAGTYDPHDQTTKNGLEPTGKLLEPLLMQIAEKVFVATKYHRDLLVESGRVSGDKVVVTGLPADIETLSKYPRVTRTVEATFCGRCTDEKGYDTVLDVQRKKAVFCTQQRSLSKAAYFGMLQRSKRVFAPSRQETFGYSVVEGMACGAMPVVPDGLSFTDYVPKEYRYLNAEEMWRLLNEEPDGEDYSTHVRKYQYQTVISRMVSEMM